jgi:hypothetical protein
MSVVSTIIVIQSKRRTNSPNKILVEKLGEGSKMENTLTVGSQFTTKKSGVSGTIQEVIKNASGSFRVRLDVNGQPRWTTVK